MRLVYEETGKDVYIGDDVKDQPGWTVEYFREPHKPASSGKVTITDGTDHCEYYVFIIGAKWIEREDRS